MLDYWERRYNELFPNGPTQEEIDEACRWEAQQREENERIRREYPTWQMAQEDEQAQQDLLQR